MTHEIHIHLHFHPGDGDVPKPLFNELKRILTMNQTELRDALTAVGAALSGVGTQLEKATNEIILAIQNAGTTTPEVDAAVANLQAVATALAAASQTLDDLNPDAP